LRLTIRDAESHDARSLKQLIQQLGYPVSAETMLRRLEKLTSSEADRVVVAEIDGEVVGMASVHISLSVEFEEPAAKLSAIVVDEKHRRRGIGEALVAAMEAEARARGCCLMFLTTAERREDAHAFYRGLGFDETGRRFAKWLR
jgi:N-acetylglutamate synthase-like GNAT family acetyltransferase